MNGSFTTRHTWSWLKSLFYNKRHEFHLVLLLFTYFFLAISAAYSIKPVRSSLFLSDYGPEKLPFVYLTTAFISLFVVYFYNQAVKKLSRNQLLIWTNLFLIINLSLFWGLFHFKSIFILSGVFYVWAGLFNLIVVLQFWSLTNDIYNPRSGKKFYGFIGAGGIIGSICTSFFVGTIVKTIGTTNILLITMGLLFLLLLTALKASHLDLKIKKKKNHKIEAPSPHEKTNKNSLLLVLKSPYIRLIALIVILMNITSTIIDYQFQSVVAERFVKDEITEFLGYFFSVVTFSSLLVQVFLTTPFHRKKGITFSLMILPFTLGFSSLAFFIFPLFLFGIGLKFFDGSLSYSLQQSSKELLYLPMSQQTKYRAKSIIDVFFFRFGDALASLIILIFIFFNFSLQSLSLAVIGLATLWCFIIIKTKTHYIKNLITVLKNRKSFTESKYQEIFNDISINHKNKNPFYLEKELQKELKSYFEYLIIQNNLELKNESSAAILEKVKDKKKEILRNLFQLLTQKYPRKHLTYAYYYFVYKNQPYDVISIELLDNVLPKRLRQEILTLFDPDLDIQEKIRKGYQYWDVPAHKIKEKLNELNLLNTFSPNP